MDPKLKEAYEMEEIALKIKERNYSIILARNLKDIRIKHYKAYDSLNKKLSNPYSAENIAGLLDISKRHYNRIESENDTVKNISIDKLLILREIYNVSLDDFFNT